MTTCGSPIQTVEMPDGVDLTTACVIQGTVAGHAGAVSGAFVRLLDGGGEFTAEVVTSDEGHYRFFAAPGDWTVRALSRVGNGTGTVTARVGVQQVDIAV